MQSLHHRQRSILAQHERWKFLVETCGNIHRPNDEATLVRCYFKPKSFSESDLIDGCTHVAYGDFCRTIHGIGELSNKDELREEAQSILRSAILALPSQLENLVPSEFEQWHRGLSERLCSVYLHGGFRFFTVGQAQKWINMTFKYIFALGETWISGLDRIYPLCHAPLDKQLGDALRKFGFPFGADGWSRISTYEEYLKRQNWIWKHFEIPPLDVEFLLWAGEDDKARAYLIQDGTPLSPRL